MNIRTFKALEAYVYRVTIRTEDWSERDVRLMEKYGEPEIDVGGNFDGSVEGSDSSGAIDLLPDVSFELDSALYGIKTGSPFSYGFDSRDYADAEDRAVVWKATIIERITDAITALRLNEDGFTGEEVVTV